MTQASSCLRVSICTWIFAPMNSVASFLIPPSFSQGKEKCKQETNGNVVFFRYFQYGLVQNSFQMLKEYSTEACTVCFTERFWSVMTFTEMVLPWCMCKYSFIKCKYEYSYFYRCFYVLLKGLELKGIQSPKSNLVKEVGFLVTVIIKNVLNTGILIPWIHNAVMQHWNKSNFGMANVKQFIWRVNIW